MNRNRIPTIKRTQIDIPGSEPNKQTQAKEQSNNKTNISPVTYRITCHATATLDGDGHRLLRSRLQLGRGRREEPVEVRIVLLLDRGQREQRRPTALVALLARLAVQAPRALAVGVEPPAAAVPLPLMSSDEMASPAAAASGLE